MSDHHHHDSKDNDSHPPAKSSKPSKSSTSNTTAQESNEANSTGGAFSSVKRNAKGGIFVAPSELHQAFEFFDGEGKGFITIQDLKKRLGVFYQNLSLREYKFLMNNKQELTEQELYALLANNELTNYDPVAEAFKIYDPNETGYIDLEVFREILSNLGFGDITDQDIQTLIDTADVDGDGRVSLADFRKMLPAAPTTTTTDATATGPVAGATSTTTKK